VTTPDPVARLRDAINSHDPERIAACFTPDYRAEIPHRPAESFTGSDRVAANWTAILARLPDIQARVLRRAADGDEIWSEWEMTAANRDQVLRGARVLVTDEDNVPGSTSVRAQVDRRKGVAR